MKEFGESLGEVLVEVTNAEKQAREEEAERQAAYKKQVSNYAEILKGNQKFMELVQNLLLAGFKTGRKKIRLTVDNDSIGYMDSIGNEIVDWSPGMKCSLFDAEGYHSDYANKEAHTISLDNCGIVLENTVRSDNYREMERAYKRFAETEELFLRGLEHAFKNVEHLDTSYVFIEGKEDDGWPYVIEGVDFKLTE